MTTCSDCFWDDDFDRCVSFHGHTCPGLAMGYRAAKAGMKWLDERRAVDEEIVAVVETDACGVDAIQVLTGCTFGKGNLIFRDFGKHAFSFLSRSSGKGVRVVLRPGPVLRDPKHLALFEKVRTGEATEKELGEFRELQKQRSREVLQKPVEELFLLQEVCVCLPPRARVLESRPCDRCGEAVMSSKLTKRRSLFLCRGCLAEEENKSKKPEEG